MKFVYILFLWVTTLVAHPIKISTCWINHTKDNQNTEFVFAMYKDDFTAYLQKINPNKQVYTKGKGVDQKIVKGYIAAHFQMWVDNKEIALNFIELKEEDQVYKVIYRTSKINAVKRKTMIKVRNTILHKAFDDQSNVVRMDLLGDKNYLSFFLENHEPVSESPVL